MSQLNGLGENDRVVLNTHRVVAICRDPSAARQRDMLDDLTRTLNSKGQLPFARLAFAAQFCDLDALYDIIRRADFSHLYEPAGWITESSFGLDQLFLRAAERLRHDIRFAALCHRAGLAAAWVEEGRWPDCADQVRYDFRAEVRRLVADASAQ
jgi:hypothetical protein